MFFLKEKLTQNENPQPQAIRDVNEFVSLSDLEKCNITLLVHQWIHCTEWVPSEWESKQLIKTSQFQQIIHRTPVYQSCEAKISMFLKVTSSQLIILLSFWSALCTKILYGFNCLGKYYTGLMDHFHDAFMVLLCHTHKKCNLNLYRISTFMFHRGK